MREELVDHRRLRHDRDEAQRAVAGRTRERVDLIDLLQERRRRAFAHRWLVSVGASLSAGAIAGGASAGAGSACRRLPRGRLAYQPSYRVATWPLYGVEHVSSIRSSSCRLPLFVAPSMRASLRCHVHRDRIGVKSLMFSHGDSQCNVVSGVSR